MYKYSYIFSKRMILLLALSHLLICIYTVIILIGYSPNQDESALNALPKLRIFEISSFICTITNFVV
jgi:hypothetical protein